jgi:hypothetical protein
MALLVAAAYAQRRADRACLHLGFALALTWWLWSNYTGGTGAQALDRRLGNGLGPAFRALGYDGVGLLMLILTASVFPFIIGAGYGERCSTLPW